MLSQFDETICALATPPGVGGIGVVRISGPQAFAAADAVTRRPRGASCASYAGHTLHRAVVTDADGVEIDDVLLAVFHGPRSYTGENVVEISAHGGPIPLRRILARLFSQGARLAEPGEFTTRAFLNGKMDLAQAEAVGDIIAAQTDEAHRLARRQDKLGAAASKIRERLLGVLARIEASIDFPEDVGELDYRLCERELEAAAGEVAALRETAPRGILYREGLRLVLVGRPNVGKSSLLNALLRTTRAIVTPIPGTTRDTIEETFNLQGIPLRAVDTAGLRETDDMVEQIGVARTRETLASADFVLHVLDAAAGLTADDAAIADEIAERPHLRVWNKWDLVTNRPDPPLSEGVSVSASGGWNIETLENAIAGAVLSGLPAFSDTQGPVVTHARHLAALQTAGVRIDDALETCRADLPADLMAVDVQAALAAIGQITGQAVGEDVIAEIFSRFCIGK